MRFPNVEFFPLIQIHNNERKEVLKYDELSLLDDKYQREDIETENGNTTKIISNENFNLDKINDSEKEIIDTIIKLLKNMKRNLIV